MDWGAIATVVAAALAFLGIVLQRARRGRRTRPVLKQDLEMLSMLPEESAAKEPLQRYIDDRLLALMDHETSVSRQRMAMARIAVMFVLVVGVGFGAGVTGRWELWFILVLAIAASVLDIYIFVTDPADRYTLTGTRNGRAPTDTIDGG